jgi:hypothetical protein
MGCSMSRNKIAEEGTYTKVSKTRLDNTKILLDRYIYVNSYIVNTLYSLLNCNSKILDFFGNGSNQKYASRNTNDIIDQHIDKFLFIPSSIYYLRVTNKQYKDHKSFVNLNNQILRNILTSRKATQIIQFLKDNDFIESDDKYSTASHKSFGYRLTKKWRELAEKGDLKFTRKETSLNLEGNSVDLGEKVNEYIYQNLQKLTIDEDLAHKILEDRIKSDNLNQFQIDGANYVIDSIKNKTHYLKRGKKTGRLFNLITSCPGYLRPSLCLETGLYDTFKLIECDIKSCQPLLLYTFYPSKTTDEAQKYKDIVESGNFYRSVIEYNEVEYNETNKGIYKDLVWKWAFGRADYDKIKCIKDYFLNNFPILKAEIEKRKVKTDKDDLRPHAKVPIALQKIESSIMIDYLVEKAEQNKIFLITIHDSFLCLEKDHKTLIDFVLERFKQEYGLIPDFNIKFLY